MHRCNALGPEAGEGRVQLATLSLRDTGLLGHVAGAGVSAWMLIDISSQYACSTQASTQEPVLDSPASS